MISLFPSELLYITQATNNFGLIISKHHWLLSLSDHFSAATLNTVSKYWKHLGQQTFVALCIDTSFSIFFLFASLNACEEISAEVCQQQNQGTSLLNKQSAPKPFQKKDEISHSYIFCELRFI